MCHYANNKAVIRQRGCGGPEVGNFELYVCPFQWYFSHIMMME